MIKYILSFLFLSVSAMAFEIPDTIFQGQLVYGKFEYGERVFLGQKELPTQDNIFIFATSRDAPKEMVLWVQKGNEKTPVFVSVTPKEWLTEYIEGVPQKTVTPSAEEQKRIDKENAMLAKSRTDRTKKGFPVCFTWPVKGRISGVFGFKRVYNGTPKSPHSGLDIAAPEGTPVGTMADGIVTLAQKDFFYTGGTVVVNHGSGVYSSYSHLSDVTVKAGDALKQGHILGKVGMTGRATGPHLHLTVSWDDVRVDPENLLQINCP